jgi:hypothetical protein
MENAELFTVFVLDGGKRLVCLLGAGRRIIELDVVELGAADDGFLLLG